MLLMMSWLLRDIELLMPMVASVPSTVATHAGYQRQHQAEAQRREDHFVVEQALVPAQGKAGEVGAGSCSR